VHGAGGTKKQKMLVKPNIKGMLEALVEEGRETKMLHVKIEH
jgi:hypothetical protein